MKIYAVAFLSLTISASALAQKHPFTFEDMMKLKRVEEPVPSPDGKWVVFSAMDVDLEANTKISHLWIVPAKGGEARRLNQSPNEEERPRFSPDGKRLIWTSKATDPSQIWMCDFDSDSGEAGGTTASGDLYLNWRGRRDLVAGREEHRLRFRSLSRLQGRRLQQATRRGSEEEQSEGENFHPAALSALDRFTEFKRSHLFVVSADGIGRARLVEPKRRRSPRSPYRK